MIKLILKVIDFIISVRMGRRYKPAYFAWGLVVMAGFVVTAVFFTHKLYFLGLVGIAGSIVCVVYQNRCCYREREEKKPGENEAVEESL